MTLRLGTLTDAAKEMHMSCVGKREADKPKKPKRHLSFGNGGEDPLELDDKPAKIAKTAKNKNVAKRGRATTAKTTPLKTESDKPNPKVRSSAKRAKLNLAIDDVKEDKDVPANTRWSNGQQMKKCKLPNFALFSMVRHQGTEMEFGFNNVFTVAHNTKGTGWKVKVLAVGYNIQAVNRARPVALVLIREPGNEWAEEEPVWINTIRLIDDSIFVRDQSSALANPKNSKYASQDKVIAQLNLGNSKTAPRECAKTTKLFNQFVAPSLLSDENKEVPLISGPEPGPAKTAADPTWPAAAQAAALMAPTQPPYSTSQRPTGPAAAAWPGPAEALPAPTGPPYSTSSHGPTGPDYPVAPFRHPNTAAGLAANAWPGPAPTPGGPSSGWISSSWSSQPSALSLSDDSRRASFNQGFNFAKEFGGHFGSAEPEKPENSALLNYMKDQKQKQEENMKAAEDRNWADKKEYEKQLFAKEREQEKFLREQNALTQQTLVTMFKQNSTNLMAMSRTASEESSKALKLALNVHVPLRAAELTEAAKTTEPHLIKSWLVDNKIKHDEDVVALAEEEGCVEGSDILLLDEATWMKLGFTKVAILKLANLKAAVK
jgi:hypothetical protein